MEFTDEQQKYIDKLIEEKTKNLFTKEDLDKKVTAEVDRRVESGIQKGLKTHKEKWEKEFEEKANLTAEELAQKRLEEKMEDISKKELEISKRTNTLNAKSLLADAEIPKNHYEKFIDILVDNDEEKTTTNVKNFIDTFNETKSELESNIQKKYSNVNPPKSKTSDVEISKSEFNKMSYMERLDLKNKNENLYKELMN